jgi:hypothetical protein
MGGVVGSKEAGQEIGVVVGELDACCNAGNPIIKVWN